MERIQSFNINHDDHHIGLYLSHSEAGIDTYDLRMKEPNGGDYISPKAIHSIEHMMATAYRNSRYKDKIVYFGPMGCRTGCYLLIRDVPYEEVKALTIECLRLCIDMSTIPGSTRVECGNYLEHDILDAKREMQMYLNAINK